MGRRGSIGRMIVRALVVMIAIILILLALLYLNRRAAARASLVGWLDQRGIQADVEVERLEIDGFVGRIRIGDPANPDVVVERVEVDYVLTLPWSSTRAGVRPGRIRMVRPVMRASYRDGAFSFGSLDPLIEEFTGAPPRPDSRGPVVVIEGGRLDLATDYGAVQVRADARIDDGKLMRLSAELPTSMLKSDRLAATGLAARLDLTTTGDRVRLSLDASADQLTLGETIEGRALVLSASGDLPYPDLKTRRGDGRADFKVNLVGQRLSSGETALRDAVLDFGFAGQTRGWIEDFGLEGDTSVEVSALQATAPGLSARGLRLASASGRTTLSQANDGLRWGLTGPATLSATSARTGDMTLDRLRLETSRLEAGGRNGNWEVTGPMSLTAGRGALGDLNLTGVTGRADLDVTNSDGILLVRADAGLKSSGGGWGLLGPVAGDDLPEMAAMKRALGRFAVDLPALRLLSGASGTEVVLQQAARITSVDGGILTLRPAQTPLYAARSGETGGGALSLTSVPGPAQIPGLPEATINIPEWRLTPGGFEARLAGRAALNFDVARGIVVETTGTLVSDRGVTSLLTPGCTAFTVERLELGENDVNSLSGALCPADRALIELRDGGWRADGNLAGVRATVPFLEARFQDVAGRLAVAGSPRGIGLNMDMSAARMEDTAEPRRFHPLTATGRASLSNEVWNGDFILASGGLASGGLTSGGLTSGGRPVAKVILTHDGAADRGGVSFDTGDMVFNQPGLQPHELTPLAVDVMKSPVRGQARFAGRFDWDTRLPLGAISSGRLDIPGMDFVSPAGPVEGLKGHVDFTSLVPLTTAPGQTLSIDRLQTVTPLTELGLTFTLGEAALRVEGGEIRAAGGLLRLEPLSVPLDGKQPFNGVIALNQVQLGDLIASAGFGDKVSLDAVVSGRLPFRWDPVSGVQIQAGNLTAVQPGRLSIQREALTGLAAAGGGEDIPPSTVQDLAYQAMQDLSFDSLTADVNSLNEGRVGVLFHIKGRHDPPQHQELRLSVSELISRKFLERTLPLPSDTGIDLTLDTSLNLNQLINDILAARRPPEDETAPLADLVP